MSNRFQNAVGFRFPLPQSRNRQQPSRPALPPPSEPKRVMAGAFRFRVPQGCLRGICPPLPPPAQPKRVSTAGPSGILCRKTEIGRFTPRPSAFAGAKTTFPFCKPADRLRCSFSCLLPKLPAAAYPPPSAQPQQQDRNASDRLCRAACHPGKTHPSGYPRLAGLPALPDCRRSFSF